MTLKNSFLLAVPYWVCVAKKEELEAMHKLDPVYFCGSLQQGPISGVVHKNIFISFHSLYIYI